ncbi:hypothetical protein EJ08DRAFT_189769 [Tothia fuscella]|uniref:Uncharacterized protein n=1 Tax=Tothia fuscella TaxID=1048955 RepID=A0A9P4NS61_9PEZI|nr:hypothetical protein EJ08DRAFT_189769 [Tothia fuscella]
MDFFARIPWNRSMLNASFNCMAALCFILPLLLSHHTCSGQAHFMFKVAAALILKSRMHLQRFSSFTILLGL